MIAIKNMEMPKCCAECDFIQRGFPDWCDLRVSNYDIFNDKIRQDWCPFVEIVQCKDCKWFVLYAEIKGREAGYCSKLKPAGYGSFVCWNDWYCADGERKDDSN